MKQQNKPQQPTNPNSNKWQQPQQPNKQQPGQKGPYQQPDRGRR